MRLQPAILPIALITALQLNAQYPVTQGKTYRFEKVADGVYYANAPAGGNSVVVVNDADVFLVDSAVTPGLARALLADLKLLTPKPVRTVVNTHFHYDHTDGNSAFATDVRIIGHEFVRTAIATFDILHREPFKLYSDTTAALNIEALRKQLAAETDAAKKVSLKRDLAAAEAIPAQLKEVKPTPPNETYTDKLTLFFPHQGGMREIQLLHLGRAHTAGDTIVYLPKERIIATGDMFQGRRLAYMGDGYFADWIATLERMKKLDVGLVLPGHGGPFSDLSLLNNLQSYLKDVVEKAGELKKQGISPEEAAKRVDLTSHAKDFPQITGPGADLRGVRRIYEYLDQNR